MGLVALSARRGQGPTSDQLVTLGPVGFVPEGFLSPRLCMVCGVVFCPPIVDAADVSASVRPDEPDDRVFTRPPREKFSEPLGTEDFPGSVEEPHLLSRTAVGGNDGNRSRGRVTPNRPVPPGGVLSLRRSHPALDEGCALRTADRILPIPIAVELRPNTAIAVLRLLEERCRSTGGAMEDSQMEEACRVYRRAVGAWRELVGEPEDG